MDSTNRDNRDKSISKRKRIRRKRIFKSIVLGMEIFVSLILITIIAFMIIPNATSKFINSGFGKWLVKSPVGKFFISRVITEEDFNNVYDSNFNRDDIDINPDIDKKTMSKYTNIALFGLDARGEEFEKSTHSDSIIIASINNETGEVKLVSLYRDTYVRLSLSDGTSKYDKLNNAYFLGGPEGAVNTINKNYDLDIRDYAIINFAGLANVIDMLGGLEVNITKDERDWINGYLIETRLITGMKAPDVTAYGDNVSLTGLQAVAYCRIRKSKFFVYDDNGKPVYTDEAGKNQLFYNNDFGRTARQRYILKKIVSKAKKAGASQMKSVADAIFKNVGGDKAFRTSMEYKTVMDMIPTLLDFKLVMEEGKQGCPYTYETPTIHSQSLVVSAGHAYNVSKLHEYLFGVKEYEPTRIVRDISNTLVKLTGVEEKRLPGDKAGND